jgi:succinate-acetate transporter protein
MNEIKPISVGNPTPVVVTPARLGNPAVVGLSGFGMTTLMLALHNLGFAAVGPVIWLGFIFGGLTQLVAGFQEQKAGNNFGYAVFTSYGCFWIALCATLVANKYGVFPVTDRDVGCFMVCWTLWTAMIWIISARVHKAMFVTFALLTLAFVLLDFEKYGGGEIYGTACNFTLIALVATVWYMQAAIILKDVAGREVLPMGKALI